MSGFVICAVCGLGCFALGYASVLRGLQGVLTVGYLFGIVRANYLDSFTYFMFDAAVGGFYLALLLGRSRPGNPSLSARAVRHWAAALIGWACVMTALPQQHLLIQLVGLRGNAFLLPFLLAGTWLTDREALGLALWVAALNLMAFGFAAAEYVVGVPFFYPDNAVTDIIYRSKDVAAHSAYRIPACFSNAHSYASAMLTSMPWLIGAVVRPRLAGPARALLIAGIAAALIGTFLTATRVFIAPMFLLIAVASLSRGMRAEVWLLWIALLAGVGYVVGTDERMQRFLSLADSEQVVARVHGSVNLNFFDILATHPMGNGMGGGGTSIPYFLSHLVRDPVGMENEYSRILLEEGLPGLLLWLGFVVWLALRPLPPSAPWAFGRRLMWYTSMSGFAIAALGTGLLTSIPYTPMFLLSVGFLCTGPRQPAPNPQPPWKGTL